VRQVWKLGKQMEICLTERQQKTATNRRQKTKVADGVNVNAR